MKQDTAKISTAGEAYLAALAAHGVDYLFGNAGTDFPAIIEGLARARLEDLPAPYPITVPHENLAVAMAHGVYLATGRPQAVMLHVNVGTANGLCGIMNAARDHVPMLFSAGRTPLTEQGDQASRSIFIHWAQEMFDQAGMVREFVKWDYEMRRADQVGDIVDRAMTLAKTAPCGPVYLTLPREVLASPAEGASRAPSAVPAVPAPNPQAIDKAGYLLAGARYPLIIASSYGRTPKEVTDLGRLAADWAIPVVSYRPRRVCLESSHPCHVGYESGGHVAKADVIVALEADVPWIPSLHQVNPNAKVIHIGIDPLFSRYPVRGFQSDLAIAGDAGLAVTALMAAMGKPRGSQMDVVEHRRVDIRNLRADQAAAREQAVARLATSGAITSGYLMHCLNQVLAGDDVLVRESQLPLDFYDFEKPGASFGGSQAGGLGWSLGAGLGVKLAKPDARVVTVAGDGSYMFGNPTPAHFVSRAYDLPMLTVVSNNRMWGSVRKATLGMYPQGAASQMNDAPLTTLEPSPDYEKVIEASGGYGEKVETPADLLPALERALDVIGSENRSALLNVQVHYSDDDAVRDART
jgi:acetolactate synthase-1/2/3 large subunit